MDPFLPHIFVLCQLYCLSVDTYTHHSVLCHFSNTSNKRFINLMTVIVIGEQNTFTILYCAHNYALNQTWLDIQ